TLILQAFQLYELKQRGYIKWLENRPGYRITVGKYRAIFEIQDDEAIVLDILRNPGPEKLYMETLRA
ncbi:hypothetical protein N9Z27_01810, partial [Alphaproteobacteria bacterium]|nr:hypothetical protein [Alphaproteobacteria bacterium]